MWPFPAADWHPVSRWVCATRAMLPGSSACVPRQRRPCTPACWAGRPVEVTESTTLASALSGGIGMTNRLTLRLVSALLDELVLVSDAEIADGISFAAGQLHQVVERGGATSVAAWLRRGAGRCACVVSGGNTTSPCSPEC
jgi:threonine dehydratase